MNDIRRTILWVVFGFSMVLLWDKWQLHNGKKATFFPSPPAATAKADASAPSSAANASVPAAASSPAGAAPAGAAAAAVPAVPREQFEVSTDVLRLNFDTEGGTLVGAELLQMADLTDAKKHFVLLKDDAQNVYVAQTGLIGGGFPTHKTAMVATPGPRTLAEGQNELSVRFESPDLGGIKLVKTYTLQRGAYDIAVRHEIINTSAAAVEPKLYVQLVRDGHKPPGESSFYSTFTGPAVYTQDKKYQKVEFKAIDENKAEYVKDATNGYVAMVQHYFASAWLLAEGVQREFFVRKLDARLYSVGMIAPLEPIAAGTSKALEARLFVGPQVETNLEKLAPGLELVKDYGWLTILSKPLYWLLDQLHKLIGNWGWSIVALVLLLKVAFYWLNAKAYASMAKMKAINPRIQEMRERLKDNPQQMQQEMMRIYREEKVNPMGGCLPIVVQIPVFIALYWVLLSSVEMRGAPWIGWVHDLAAPDPLFILPVLMTLSSLLQTALNPAPPDPMQAKMMWIMPLMFSVMFFFFPAGLVLYWLTNNLLSIAQQWIINTRMGVPPQFNLPRFK